MNKIKTALPWAFLVLFLVVFGYLSYEVGQIKAYESVTIANYTAFQQQIIAVTNTNTQNINTIAQFLNSLQPKK